MRRGISIIAVIAYTLSSMLNTLNIELIRDLHSVDPGMNLFSSLLLGVGFAELAKYVSRKKMDVALICIWATYCIGCLRADLRTSLALFEGWSEVLVVLTQGI